MTFYLPGHHWPEPSRREQWARGEPPDVLPEGKPATIESWILRPWSNLHRAGLPVELSTDFPQQGIAVALNGTLSPNFRPPPNVFLLGVAADGLPHPAAHLHILQNPAHARRLPWAIAIPHWPQPALIPRNFQRGETFENADFFGDPRNLAPEIRNPAWQKLLHEKAGVRLRLRPATFWSDYSTTDCALAIRDFIGRVHLNKPATKLINAWRAGVPVLGGKESAHWAVGKPSVDFLLCSSPEQTLAALCDLKSDPALRSRLVRAGTLRAEQFTEQALLVRWQKLLWEEAKEKARRWQRLPRAARAARKLANRIFLAWDRLTLR